MLIKIRDFSPAKRVNSLMVLAAPLLQKSKVGIRYWFTHRHTGMWGFDMKNVSKKHHYIPRFYLKGFLADNCDMLCVLDQKAGKTFRVKPDNIAYQNHLYSVEQKENVNIGEDAIEKSFANIEGLMAPIISGIVQNRMLPTNTDYNVLINFIALMSCRVPVMSELSMKPLKEMTIMSLKMAMSSKENYLHMIEKLKKEGKDLGDGSEYEKVKEFLYSERYKIDINQNFKLKSVLDNMEILIPILAKRKWSLIFTDDFFGGFICSDNPVALVSLDRTPSLYGPGFAMKNTEVTMPLSKSIALRGRFEGEKEVGFTLPQTLAAMNSRTAMYADKFIFSANDDFLYINRNGHMGNRKELINDILQKVKRERK